MLYRISTLFLLFYLTACVDNQNVKDPQNMPFPDMEVLIDHQITQLIAQKKGLQKELLNQDGKTETQDIAVDSLRWSQELKLFRQIDLNRPEWIEAYNIQTKDNYMLAQTDSDKLSIRRFEFEGSPKLPIYLKVESYTNTLLYESKQTLEMKFESGILKSYKVSGSQQVIGGKAMPYRINGKVI